MGRPHAEGSLYTADDLRVLGKVFEDTKRPGRTIRVTGRHPHSPEGAGERTLYLAHLLSYPLNPNKHHYQQHTKLTLKTLNANFIEVME